MRARAVLAKGERTRARIGQGPYFVDYTKGRCEVPRGRLEAVIRFDGPHRGLSFRVGHGSPALQEEANDRAHLSDGWRSCQAQEDYLNYQKALQKRLLTLVQRRGKG